MKKLRVKKEATGEVRFWEWLRAERIKQKTRQEYREEEYWNGSQDNAEKALEEHNAKYGWVF